MIRTLLTTTALAALMATGAIAQDAPANQEAPAAESTTETQVVEDVEVIVEGSDQQAQGGQQGTMGDPSCEGLAQMLEQNSGQFDQNWSAEALAAVEARDEQTCILLFEEANALLGQNQQNQQNQQTQTEGQATQQTDGQATQQMSAETANLLAQGYQVADTDNLASNIMGAGVYSSAGDDAEHIGDINDLVVTDQGEVAAVIIGVGGFLGIGEKRVAVDYSQLEFTIAADNTERYVLATTREDLEAAPEFEDREDRPEAGGAMAPAGGQNMEGGAGAMAPADGGTMQTDQDQVATEGQATEGQATEGQAAGSLQEGFQEVDAANLTAEELEGADVYNHNDEHIGSIGNLVLNQDGQIDAVVIDFGGFLGIGTKQVAVAFENLRFLRDDGDNLLLILNVTREQMEQAPDFDEATYQQDPDRQRLVLQ